jgi:hypothetical protein
VGTRATAFLGLLALSAVLAGTTRVAGQGAPLPRTPAGKPDFSGIWETLS